MDRTEVFSSLQVIILQLTVAMFGCVSAQNSLTGADIQELLDAHNMFRTQVMPEASNMQRLVCHHACGLCGLSISIIHVSQVIIIASLPF